MTAVMSSQTGLLVGIAFLGVALFIVPFAYSLGARDEARLWARNVGGHTHQITEDGFEHRCNQPRLRGRPDREWTCPICGLIWKPSGKGGWCAEGQCGIPVSFTMAYPDGDRVTFQIRPRKEQQR